MKNYLLPLLCALIVLTGAGSSDMFAQNLPTELRVDPTLRRRTEIDGNNVRTSVFNFVFSGRTGAGQGIPYEFPKNTGRFYVALVALFVGGEVVDNTGTTVRVVDIPAFRTNPATGEDWNIGPIPGYFNPTVGRLAKSDEPDTWPMTWPDKLSDSLDPGWPGSWNGFFGKDQFNADQEMFYRAGDDNYTRWNYSPDANYPDRRGLGMLIDQRVLQWSQVSVADAVFFISAVRNDGTKRIKKTAVTLWLADFVGGDGDSQDDTPTFDLIQDIAFSLDANGISSNPAFLGVCVGAAATLYLETPGNAVDRIDNDGDSPEYDLGPKVTGDFFLAQIPGTIAEISGDQIDNNLNGLIDEDSTHIAFGAQRGVGYGDRIDNNDDGEGESPVVTAAMVSEAGLDPWNRWPANPEADAFQDSIIHLIGVGSEDEGKKFADNIDNDGDAVADLPTITQAIVDAAAADPLKRYRVPGTSVILYSVGPEDLGRKYLNDDGLRVTGIDENIDEMVDEGRNDGIDNDGDWNIFTDDVGLDGAEGTGDFGEGDGRPTSGVGTDLPGEPNIDKTDVSEADQIGLTNVQYLAAGAIDFGTTPDVFFWQNFMLPGRFVDPETIPSPGEFDLFVSSGVFPMNPGQIEQISYAVVFGNASTCPGNADVTGAKADALRKRDAAQLAYDEDYQFAQAPLEPTVTAVAGARLVNGAWQPKVTLYWDDVAESSEDRFLSGIVGMPVKDFEGYKVYRSTDPAFEDARVITDAFGNPAPWLSPLATFDLRNGISGFHPVPFNGVQFHMGNDVGLSHTFVDTTAKFGQTYYYAVRAYDQGYAPLNITPAESNLKISIDELTGEVTSLGSSVVVVTAEAPAAGYVAPLVSDIDLVQGTTTGTIGYVIIDPRDIRDNHTYRVTFQDTVLSGGASRPDTFLTKNFTLADVTNPNALDTLIDRSTAVTDTLEQPVTDGFRLELHNETQFGLNSELSGWNAIDVNNFIFAQWKFGFEVGQQKPSDYLLVFFDQAGADTSTLYRAGSTTWPAIPVNFKVYNVSEDRQIDFGFIELDVVDGPGLMSVANVNNLIRTDRIIFLEPNQNDSLVSTWNVSLSWDVLRRRPMADDSLTIILSKLFRSSDIFEFTTTAQKVESDLAKSDLQNIRVVPNPYVAAAEWEPKNPFTSGRGPRSIHFTHLPQRCTIRIFTVSGELVQTIMHESTIDNGTADWNLLTRDNLAVSYGVYVYHVDAFELGERVGKFAIIK
ncbi:MAG: hypothetical protein OEV30_03975 [Ignavibacteria bacterium]|nr:hypothetical protein [Ignavibacteria bacterium]